MDLDFVVGVGAGLVVLVDHKDTHIYAADHNSDTGGQVAPGHNSVGVSAGQSRGQGDGLGHGGHDGTKRGTHHDDGGIEHQVQRGDEAVPPATFIPANSQLHTYQLLGKDKNMVREQANRYGRRWQ